MSEGLFQKKVSSRYWMCPSSNTSTHFMATYLSEPQKKQEEGREKRFDFRIKNFGKDKQTDCFPRFFLEGKR